MVILISYPIYFLKIAAKLQKNFYMCKKNRNFAAFFR